MDQSWVVFHLQNSKFGQIYESIFFHYHQIWHFIQINIFQLSQMSKGWSLQSLNRIFRHWNGLKLVQGTRKILVQIKSLFEHCLKYWPLVSGRADTAKKFSRQGPGRTDFSKLINYGPLAPYLWLIIRLIDGAINKWETHQVSFQTLDLVKCSLIMHSTSKIDNKPPNEFNYPQLVLPFIGNLEVLYSSLL